MPEKITINGNDLLSEQRHQQLEQVAKGMLRQFEILYTYEGIDACCQIAEQYRDLLISLGVSLDD